jgi:hypothetical protein
MLEKKRMIDLIDRKKLLDEFRLYPTGMSDDNYDFIERLINSQRTIIPIQHAHWIKENVENTTYYFQYKLFCSNCKGQSPLSSNYNYCPYCGCKMDEKTE